MDYNKLYYCPIDIRTDGKITIFFQYLKEKKPFDDELLCLKLLNKMNKIDGVDIFIDRISSRPTLPIFVLKDEKSIANFINTLSWQFKKSNRCKYLILFKVDPIKMN